MNTKEISWLGIRPDGTHSRKLSDTEARCVAALKNHVGRPDAIAAEDLVEHVFGIMADQEDKRNLRHLINHLIITHRMSILCMAGPGGGYYLPATPEEVRAFYHAFHKRAMTGLVKASRGQKAAFIDTIEQLTLWYDAPEGEALLARLTPERDKDPTPAWVQLVTRHLERLSADPQKFAAEIAALQDKFGDIFVPRAKLQRLNALSDELQTLLKEVA